MLFVFIFLLGISIGSFLNVLIDRIPRSESVLKGRSYCEECKTVLRWYDLIPLFSFIQIKGKCRYCQTKLSFYYPSVELLTGIFFVLVYALHPLVNNTYQVLSIMDIASLLYYLFIVCAFIVIFFTDLKYGIIPDSILYSAIFFSTISIILNQIPIFNYLLSAIASFLFFLVIFLITKGRGMGFGDVKLSFLIGLLLGFPRVISAFYLAFLTGAIVSIILILIGRKKFFGGTIPFGPFLIIGTMVSFFAGDYLLKMFFGGMF